MVAGVGQAPNGAPLHFVLGRLAWVEDQSGRRFSSFDARGRQTTDVRVVLDRQHGNAVLGTWVRSREYDDLDRETAHAFPDGSQVTYQYSARGLLDRVRDGGDPPHDHVTQIDYNAAGQPVRRALGDGNGTDDVLPGFTSYHFYYHPDMLHTASVVTDDDGAQVERRNYLPFGAPEADTSLAPYATYREPYGFTGKEHDDDFGLQYYGARYLVPALGRWLSADPLYLLNPERAHDEINELNLYSYCAGHPLSAYDPTGNVLQFAKAFVGAAVATLAAPAILAGQLIRQAAMSPQGQNVVRALTTWGGRHGVALQRSTNALASANPNKPVEVANKAVPVVQHGLKAYTHIQGSRADTAVRGAAQQARGIVYSLKRPSGVSDAAWQAKVNKMNAAAARGEAKVVHHPTRSGAAQREARAAGDIKPGHDADHGLDLWAGGADARPNITSTPPRINRSVGGQSRARLDYPDGTPIKEFVTKK
jgi:RHS repeat-associated protein